MQLSDYRVHVKTLSTTRWTKAEEIAVVRNLVLAFLTADVYGYRHALTVCIVDFQWCLFAVLDAFLVHQASSGIAQREETVIFGIHAVTVSWE